MPDDELNIWSSARNNDKTVFLMGKDTTYDRDRAFNSSNVATELKEGMLNSFFPVSHSIHLTSLFSYTAFKILSSISAKC